MSNVSFSLSRNNLPSVHPPELEGLYFILLCSRFAFVGAVEVDIEAIYEATEREYPELCTTALCTCDAGRVRPAEWQHMVRRALDRLASWGIVARGKVKGSWHLAASLKA